MPKLTHRQREIMRNIEEGRPITARPKTRRHSTGSGGAFWRCVQHLIDTGMIEQEPGRAYKVTPAGVSALEGRS